MNPLIDGTVEGTDVATGYVDGNRFHDHSYYGNGCPGTWVNDPPYYGGSPTACSTRIVKTYDNEDLSIGTYYHYEAATVGTGAALVTDNTDVPDTFCPLGWQMPYGGTGGDYYNKSRSWRYLMSKYNYGDNSTGSNKSRSYPVSRILDGTYFWGSGALMQQDTASHLWSLTVQSDIKAYRLHMGVDYVRYQPMEKHAGNPVRCFYIFSTLSSTAR